MRPWHVLVFAVLGVACTAGAGGGALWTGVAALVATVAFIASCAGPKDDPDAGPDIGPCLSIAPSDVAIQNNNDPDIGPCLSIAIDTGNSNNEADVGPCLTPLPPDFGTPDMGTDAGEPDMDVGTSGDAGDAGDLGDMSALPSNKSQLLAKLRDRLPDDVVSRLESEDDLV